MSSHEGALSALATCEVFSNMNEKVACAEARYEIEPQTFSYIEPFSSCVCLADLQCVDGLGELAGAPGAAAELAQDAPGLELGVRALAG
jgi:hypothetical protein